MTLKSKWEAFSARVGLSRLAATVSNWINTSDADQQEDVQVSE